MDLKKETIQIDFLKILTKMLSFWWLFLLSMGIAIGGTILYLRTITPKYASRSIVVIKSTGRSDEISTEDVLRDQKGFQRMKSMDNEIQILKSLNLWEKVAERLQLNVRYFRLDALKETETYTATPFLLDSFRFHQPNDFGSTFFLEIADDKSFILKKDKETEGIQYFYDVPFENELGLFTLSINSKKKMVKGTYRLTIGKVESVASSYKSRISIVRFGNQRNASMLALSLVDPVPEKASEVLNTLIDIYNEEEIRNKKETLKGALDFINQRIDNLRNELETIGKIVQRNNSILFLDKKLAETVQTQKAKETLLFFLMQKREETILAERGITAKSRIIDRARTPRFSIYPRRKLILLTSGVVGFLMPFTFVLLLGLFDPKIDSEAAIKRLTRIPILGKISKGKEKEKIVVKRESRSGIMEMFRFLRTRLRFINQDKSKQIIMMTSASDGEEKTFVVLNLGITLSLADKKVIILSMDFRQPKLAEFLGISQKNGVINYLLGQNTLEELIQTDRNNANLSYITSGAALPNAAELMLSDKTKQLFHELSARFDYVLIDTPPLGQISDALLLRKFVDNTLIVVDNKYTRKEQLINLEQMYQNKELPEAHIIFYEANKQALNLKFSKKAIIDA